MIDAFLQTAKDFQQNAAKVFLRSTAKLLLGLRYRIEVRGLEKIAAKGTRGILFLPNHPAIVDPVMLLSCLNGPFAPAILADQDQVDRPILRWAAKHMNVRPMLDVRKYGLDARPQVEATIQKAIIDLNAGGNLLFYPSGHAYRSKNEDLRGNSAAHLVLRDAPKARVVLIRTHGLWGSGFGYASGKPQLGNMVQFGIKQVLANGIFATPHRRVTIELFEPTDLPRNSDRNALNRYLEAFYNENPPPNTYVPYRISELRGPRSLPDPELPPTVSSPDEVPANIRKMVTDYIGKLAGFDRLKPEDRLAYDLGMDSLDRADLVVWLAKEFGVLDGDVDSLQTVGDVMVAAAREAVLTRPTQLIAVPKLWHQSWPHERCTEIPGQTITDAFLLRAKQHPDRAVIADQISGVKTYRELIMGILALRPAIEKLAGERVGIMLPASAAANVAYMACLFAGKTPVMINWTTGIRDMKHALDTLGVQCVLTAGGLISRIESQGTNLAPIKKQLVLLEDLRKQMTLGTKLRAAVMSRLSWASLRNTRVSPTAVILLTSGSETLPKAVPLTHANMLDNLRDVLKVVRIYHDDCLLGFLPPFHTFGMTVTIVLPLVAGARVAYHANPTEGATLAKMIHAYRANLLVGTPTFLGNIIRASMPGQLDSLRLAVTGAEKCSQRTYEMIAQHCPRATILEGYGITECSPIVAVNSDQQPQPYTIGQVMPSLEYAIVNPDTLQQRVATGETGLLLVRGPSIFGGYLNTDVASPFVEFESKSWYRTGDLVSEDNQSTLTFRGRLKRFVKIGGEMISLPAIEAALEAHYASSSGSTGSTDEGPVLAVEATPDENRPELVLFTTKTADRNTVNKLLRDAGLSPLYTISQVKRLASIPVLGSGKTDYRALKRLLEN